MPAPWQETNIKVVVEFKKSNHGAKRIIALAHSPTVVPPQLYGRISPETWKAFMEEIQGLANYHPYTQKQNIGQCCFNLQGLFCALCIGFGFFNPDGGNYAVWTREVSDCLAHHQPAFSAGGCTLSLQSVHGSFWVQVDINPNVAVGYAVPPPAKMVDGPAGKLADSSSSSYPPGATPTGSYAPPAGAGAPPPGYPAPDKAAAYPPAGAPPGQQYAYPPAGAPPGQQYAYPPPQGTYPPPPATGYPAVPPAGYPQ